MSDLPQIHNKTNVSNLVIAELTDGSHVAFPHGCAIVGVTFRAVHYVGADCEIEWLATLLSRFDDPFVRRSFNRTQIAPRLKAIADACVDL